MAGWHPGALTSIRSLVGRPLWGRGAADEDWRLARGYSFQIKRISPRASQERFPGGFRISPRDPLETTKGEACGPLLWKPLGGWTGERGLRGTVGRGTKDGGGVLAVIQGFSPCGGQGWGGRGSFGAGIRRARALQGTGAARRGRRALRVGAEGPINHPGQPAHSEALAAAGAREGWKSARGASPKGIAATSTGGALSETGTFASAASGGKSEQKGVAAVKIL